eukprot:1831036-Heterocapsa_arctica.AAC.1
MFVGLGGNPNYNSVFGVLGYVGGFPQNPQSGFCPENQTTTVPSVVGKGGKGKDLVCYNCGGKGHPSRL